MKPWVSVYVKFVRKGLENSLSFLKWRNINLDENKPPKEICYTAYDLVSHLFEFAINSEIITIEEANDQIFKLSGILNYMRFEKVED